MEGGAFWRRALLGGFDGISVWRVLELFSEWLFGAVALAVLLG